MTSLETAGSSQVGERTLVIDSSALLCRYLADRRHRLVVDTMADADSWVVTGLARSEVLLAVHECVADAAERDEAWRRIRSDWDGFWEIPIDDRCLSRAADIGARYRLGVTNALHLAAIDRLARSVTILTFDRAQVAAAVALGFEVYTEAGDDKTTSSTAHALLASE